MKRKRIGLLTAYPEGIYAKRIMEGVFAQCCAYDYDVFVFTPLVQVVHYFRDYLNGELNIFRLMNFDQIDGLIVDTSTLTEDHIPWVAEMLLKQIKESCDKPVVSVDLAFGDYPVVNTDDILTMSEITAHVLDHHGCRDIYYLSGYYGHEVAEERLRGFTQELEKRNIPVEQDKIFYGDFWYTGGETLADRIISGELKLPEAIICASDHLAIGLANRLMKHGIKIPEQVIVTGHDATAEAMLNHLTITTHVPETSRSSAEAVNRIRAILEPEKEILPPAEPELHGLITGESCGCGTNTACLHEILSTALVHNYQNLTNSDNQDQVDLGRLNISYMFESITEKPSVHEALYGIMYNSYLLRPYRNFWLCLRDDWLDTAHTYKEGYPEIMRNVLHAVPQNSVLAGQTQHCGDSPMYNFNTKDLIPEFPENRETPSVFYFTPVHFQDNMLGYAVLECDLAQKHTIGSVYHLWLRNVSNALEMKRLHERGERAAQELARAQERPAQTENAENA
ncbi:MAG: substrate-binding domain-containing protein [Oscillospiraceae bacterium]|nr:substrate-binding domain-containing protein [Oscillospiraceae bacterium]